MSRGKANGAIGRIGYVLRKFPVLSETFILNELLELEARGQPLYIISLMRPNDPRFHEDLPKLKARVTYLPQPHELVKLFRYHGRLMRGDGKRYSKALLYAATRGKPGLAWRFVQSAFVANEVRRMKLVHLHAHFANSPATVALLASKLTGVPFSFTAHATDIYKYKVNPKALASKVRAARFVVTVSDFNKTHMERTTQTNGDKIVRLYNGIDLERFSPNGVPPPQPFRVICVARLVEKKGLPVLIDACRRLRDSGLDFRCEIVGKGRLRSELKSQIKRHKLGKHVSLVGPQSQVEVLGRYQAAHLYVLPCVIGSDGNREGLPVSIVEALACGLPVVTTPVTGIPEVVRDRHNGLIIPPGDSEILAAAIETLIRDPALYQQLRRNARPSVASRFDRRRTAAVLHELLEGREA